MAKRILSTAFAGLISGLGVLFIYNKYIKKHTEADNKTKTTEVAKEKMTAVISDENAADFSVADMSIEEIEAIPAEQISKIQLDDWSLEVADTGTSQKSSDSPYNNVVKNIYNRAVVMSTRKWVNLELDFSKLTNDGSYNFQKALDNFFLQNITT